VTDEKIVPVTDAETDSASPVEQTPPKKDTGSTAKAAPPPKVAKPRGGNGGVWLVLLLLIAALAYAAWCVTRAHGEHQQELVNLQQQLQQQLQEQQHALVAQQKTLADDVEQQLTQQEEKLQENLTDIGQRVENTSARVLAMSSVNRDDWKLAEAEYLLRLANQRVLLERNSGNAVALAQTVDEILRDLNDPDLHPVRRALALEMGELKLAGDIDREGVYLRLLVLSQQIDKLPLIEPLGDNNDPWLLYDEEAQEQAQLQESYWKKFKRGTNELLKKFSHHLRVRDHAEPTAAILPPDNQLYLKQNMRLMLEQAQSALLREEPQVYEASLEKAREWLEIYFPLNPQSVAVKAEVTELQGVIISQSLPNFAESITLLKNYIERKHQVSVAGSGGNE
jgi:uroporphyrin-3 C-methyltransferase